MSYEHNVVPARTLPNRRPQRLWGGTSAGAHCAVCGACVKRGEPEMELDFYEEGDEARAETYHVHVCCYWDWAGEAGGS